MKIRLKDKIVNWIWRKTFCGFRNYYYLDRFKEKGDIEDIEKFLRYSHDAQMDVEELVNDGYYYAYYCDGEWCHVHSLHSLYVDIVNILIDNPDAEIKLADDEYYTTYSTVDEVIVDKLIRKIRELVKEQK